MVERVARTLVVACVLSLAGCNAFTPDPKVTCTRHSNGEIIHGEVVRFMDGSAAEFDVKDSNGLPGRIDASNSSAFTCVVQS